MGNISPLEEARFCPRLQFVATYYGTSIWLQPHIHSANNFNQLKHIHEYIPKMIYAIKLYHKIQTYHENL
jgi:hypothetical protein